MNPELVNTITNQTRQTYDDIAVEFSNTRHTLWPELIPILDYIKDGEAILDVGCGNGRILKLFKDKSINYIGIDPSNKLIDLAKTLHPEGKFMVGDSVKLPFADASFDHILMIAVLHHIPDYDFRQRTLREIKRVLKPGGIFFLTNWNRWQPKFIWHIIKGLWVNGFSWGDFYLPWNKQAKRYYYAFTKSGLKRELEDSGFKIIKHTTERDNFVTFCQK